MFLAYILCILVVENDSCDRAIDRTHLWQTWHAGIQDSGLNIWGLFAPSLVENAIRSVWRFFAPEQDYTMFYLTFVGGIG